MALFTDMQRPENYTVLRDKEELKKCYEVFIEKFSMIQVVFMEIIAMSAGHHPRTSFTTFF